MKRRGVLLLAAAILGLAALLRFWPGRPLGEFATPAACLDAFRDACKDGDLNRYLSCLGEPLRSEKAGSLRRADLLAEMEGVTGWTRLEPIVAGASARVDVDEVKSARTYRRRFRLEQTPRGWLIVAVEPPREVPTPVRYGTHISETEGP